MQKTTKLRKIVLKRGLKCTSIELKDVQISFEKG